MATVVGEAGGTALRKALIRAAIMPAALVVLAMFTLPPLIWSLKTTDHPLFMLGTFTTSLAASFWWTRKDWLDAYELLLESKDWARGAKGERVSADEMAHLPEDYLILNDVHPRFRDLAANWNWDHVVIGPKGLFVVDSKNYSASRIQDGRSDSRTRRNVKQVRGYALSFKNHLVRLNPELRSIFVVPVLAYVNEGTWVERLREEDVRVLPLRLLRNDIVTGPGSPLVTAEAVKIANLLFDMYELHQQDAYRDDFRRWAARVRANPWAAVPPHPKSSPETAAPCSEEIQPCPLCGASMTKRSGYNEFFGCVNYRLTGCKGKRALDGRPI